MSVSYLLFFFIVKDDMFENILFYFEILISYNWNSLRKSFNVTKMVKLLKEILYSTNALGCMYAVHSSNVELKQKLNCQHFYKKIKIK